MSAVFDSDRILVSIPPEAFISENPSSSIFQISDDLIDLVDMNTQRALRTLQYAAVDLGVSLFGVMRPEIFTDEQTLGYLHKITGPVTDHVCLSTGRTIKLVPGANNHVYLYDLAGKGNLSSFKDLCRRAPELVAQVSSQINTSLAVQRRNFSFAPPTIYMQPPLRPEIAASPQAYSWWMMRERRTGLDSIIDLAKFIANRGKISRQVQYIVLGSAALQSREYLRHICTALYLAVYHDELVCLELPADALSLRDDWVNATYELLAQTGFRMPKLRTSNIILVGPNTLEYLCRRSIVRIELSMYFTDPVCDYMLEDTNFISAIKIFADVGFVDQDNFQSLASATFTAPIEFVWTAE